MTLSIITINRNNLGGLQKTINSVCAQTEQNFEYVIIDGASTDGSKELIELLGIDKRLSYWCSEPDLGIYNAMNKGILQAKGDYLLFLNSGDYLHDENVISDFISSGFNEEIVSGAIVFLEKQQLRRDAILKDELEFEHLYNNRIPHPATFIRRSLFDKYGLYNEQLRIISDWEFFLKCLILFHCSYSHWDRVVSCFDMNGISSSPEYINILQQETNSVYKQYLPLVYKSYKRLNEENFKLISLLEQVNREYHSLLNGKLGFIIRLFIRLKKKWK